MTSNNRGQINLSKTAYLEYKEITHCILHASSQLCGVMNIDLIAFLLTYSIS